jgi:hypothetical protein
VATACALLYRMLPSESLVAPGAEQRVRDATQEPELVSRLREEDVLSTAAAADRAEGRQAASERLQQLKAQVNREQLAVQKVRALGTLRCANLGCPNMSAASEAQLQSKLCSGCRVVRFCSEGCSQAAWRQHKVACKLLARERQAQG